MKCSGCNKTIHPGKVQIAPGGHDGNWLEVRFACPLCQWIFYTYVAMETFAAEEDAKRLLHANRQKTIQAVKPWNAFQQLAELIDEAETAHTIPATVAEESMEEIKEVIMMLDLNFEEDGGAPAALIQNLAALSTAVRRMAEIVLTDLPVDRLAQLIEENRP